MSDYQTSGSPLRHLLEDTAAAQGVPLKDLTVLAVQNDPFRIDTPAGHRDGQWLAINAERLGLANRKIHLRGLHYALVTDAPAKPNGEPYRNTAEDWRWLQEKAADAARWLGYIPFDRIVDQRNAAPDVRIFEEPRPQPYISVGVDVDIPSADDIEPSVGAHYMAQGKPRAGFGGVQPYKLVIVGEKSSLEDVLAPIAREYKADLYLPTGEPSDTLLYQMARIGADDGRPMVVLYFSDADPAGWQMPISVGRKLQALGPFYDQTLDRRVMEAYGQWQTEAQAILDGSLDSARLEQIRGDAAQRLGELREQIGAINDALRIDVDDLDLPPIVVPTADLDGCVYPLPLLDSGWSFADQCRALIDSKAYRNQGDGG